VAELVVKAVGVVELLLRAERHSDWQTRDERIRRYLQCFAADPGKAALRFCKALVSRTS
jgi:hypothetical protein